MFSDQFKKKQFNILIMFYVSYLWFTAFTRAVLPTYFRREGLSINQILIGVGVGYFGQLLFMFFLRWFSGKFSSRLSWRLAMISFIVYVFMLINIRSVYNFYIAAAIGGLTTGLFYIYYNISHFKLTSKEKVGHSSSIIFNVRSIVTIFAPLLAGFLASINYYFIWLFSLLFFIAPFFLSGKQEKYHVRFTFKDIFSEISKTRILIFLEGIWETIIYGIIPVYTLFFIKDPLNYGSYIAYLSVVSILANRFLSRLSDKLQRRAVFLFPLTMLMAVITFAFSLATENILIWIVISGSIHMLTPIFWSFAAAIVVDGHENIENAMIGREFLLATGRVLGLAIAAVGFYLESTPFYTFFFFGLVMLLFSAILFWRKKYRGEYNYL